MLTWWQGTGLGSLSSGTDYIHNDHFQQIATVNAGGGARGAAAPGRARPGKRLPG